MADKDVLRKYGDHIVGECAKWYEASDFSGWMRRDAECTCGWSEIEAALITDAGPEAPPPGQSVEHHWVGGNDITWCTKCGVEYDHRKTLRPTVECAPSPAGQVEALDELDRIVWEEKDRYCGNGPDDAQRGAAGQVCQAISHRLTALRASAQPTPSAESAGRPN